MNEEDFLDLDDMTDDFLGLEDSGDCQSNSGKLAASRPLDLSMELLSQDSDLSLHLLSDENLVNMLDGSSRKDLNFSAVSSNDTLNFTSILDSVGNILEEAPPSNIGVSSAANSDWFSCSQLDDQVLAESCFVTRNSSETPKKSPLFSADSASPMPAKSAAKVQDLEMQHATSQLVGIPRLQTVEEEESQEDVSTTPRNSPLSIIDRFVMDSPNTSPRKSNSPAASVATPSRYRADDKGKFETTSPSFALEEAKKSFVMASNSTCSLLRKPSRLKSPAKKISAFRPIALAVAKSTVDEEVVMSGTDDIPTKVPSSLKQDISQRAPEQPSPSMTTRTRTYSSSSLSFNKSSIPVPSSSNQPASRLARSATMRYKFDSNAPASIGSPPTYRNKDFKRPVSTPESQQTGREYTSKFIKSNATTKIPVPQPSKLPRQDGTKWSSFKQRLNPFSSRNGRTGGEEKDLLAKFDDLDI